MFPHPSLLLLGSGGGSGGGTVLSDKWRLYPKAQVNTGWDTVIRDIQMRSVNGGPNLCVGGVASALYSTATAANAFDGNSATIWENGVNGDPGWIQYDFPAPVSVQEVVISTHSFGAQLFQAFVMAYWDGSTWQNLWYAYDDALSTVSSTFTYGIGYANRINRSDDPLASTKWRILNQVTAQYRSITELEMRAASGGIDQTYKTLGIATHSAAYLGAYVSSKAFDNILTQTGWLSNADNNSWLAYEFPFPVMVNEISVRLISADAASGWGLRVFDVQRYDGLAWQTHWSESTGAWSGDTTRIFTKP